MADNRVASAAIGTGPTFALAELSFSGDTAVLPIVTNGILLGSEGAWTFTLHVGGAGVVGSGVQRITLASDDPAVAALQIIDDWDESDRAKVNVIAGQVGIAGGTGVDGATVPRVSLATNVALPAGTSILGKVGIDQTTPGTTNLVAAGQSGTWTVLPGNTANTTAWKVDGSAVTQPVSLAAGATSIGKAEDVASADADVGVPAQAVRKATPANTSGTDGDYEFLQISDGRLWVSTIVDTALPAGTNAIGKLASNTGVTIGAVEIAAAQTIATVTTVGTVTNLSQLGGVAIAMNTGTRSAGTQRVTICTDDVVPASQSGTWNIGTVTTLTTCGTLTALTGGGVAHDGADSGNPVKIGGRAVAGLSGATLVAAADRSDAVMSLDGAQIVRTVPLEDIVRERTTNTDGASTAFASGLGAPGAGVKIYLTHMTICNSSASFCTVDIRDGSAGAVLWTTPVPATGGATEHFDPPIPFSANTAVAFDASAATSTLTISAMGFKSKI